MSVFDFLWQAMSYSNNLDNRIRKRWYKKWAEMVWWYFKAELNQNWINNFNGAIDTATNAIVDKIDEAPLNKFNWNSNTKKKDTSNKWSDEIKDTNTQKDNAWSQSDSWSPKTSTVSNNKNNNNKTTTNQAPARQTPTQYQPEDYEAWRQRKMANWTSYNEVFENAVDKFIADPNSFTQEQKNALIEMWNKLWYDLWTTATSTATPEYHPQPQNNSYYSNQWDYNFRFSL